MPSLLVLNCAFPPKAGDGFPEAMRAWATGSAALFGALLRHITGSDEGYELVAQQLLVRVILVGVISLFKLRLSF